MSNNANRGSRRNRRQRPNQEVTPDAEQADDAGEGAAQAPERAPEASVSFSGIEVITRLRDRVETAAFELKRLREENTALAARLQALEAQPAATALPLDQDPEVLRRKITGFIDAIDRYLEQENTQG